MLREWQEEDLPHFVAGGPNDGLIVRRPWAADTPGVFGYSTPGLRTLRSMYLEAVAMVPLTIEQANAIDRARDAAREKETR